MMDHPILAVHSRKRHESTEFQKIKMSLNRHPKTRRRRVRQFVKNLLLGDRCQTDPKRGRLLLESLENRQLLAGDMELLFTEGVAADQATGQPSVVSASTTSDSTTSGLQVAGQAEGESAPDLVQFAKDLTAAGAKFYGAAWCPFCSDQKQLFDDGGNELPFVEVTNSDRTLNSIGQAEQITAFPTWKFPGKTPVEGVLTLRN